MKFQMRRHNKIQIFSSIIVLCLVSILFLPAQSSAGTLNSKEPVPLVGGKDKASPDIASEKGPLKISVQGAIMMALDNNRSLRVEKLTPEIKKTLEDQENAVFSPVIGGDVSVTQEKAKTQSRSAREIESGDTDTEVNVSRFYPTGTDVEVNLSSQLSWSDLYSDFNSTRLGVSVTQSLLRGRDLDYNLAKIRQARLNTRMSRYEVRGFSESLVADIENTYWDYALAKRQIEIYTESLRLAERQKNEINEMIKFGKLPESELVAAMAEIAMRREGLINARSTLEKTKLKLLRLLNPPDKNIWGKNVTLTDQPVVPDAKMDTVDTHVALALARRPDINQAQLKIDSGDIEIARTKNGILPKMDLFITLGKTGYSDSFGSSLRDLDENSYDAYAGITFEYPFSNKAAKARHRNAALTKEQSEAAMENLKQLAEVDVRSAYIEVERAKKQIEATEATYTLQKEKLRIETEKFRFGKSTTLLVAQAQRDLLASRISQTQTIVTYLKSFVDLYRLEGSLLERRGISLID